MSCSMGARNFGRIQEFGPGPNERGSERNSRINVKEEKRACVALNFLRMSGIVGHEEGKHVA